MDLNRKLVKSDCEELLSRFQKTDSVRFEIFSNTWREMKFSHIFYGTKKREKRVFSRLVLDTASSFFLPPYSFQIRVGGLYLLYSLYQCQTTSPPEQIRLALKDWEDVKKFEKDALNAQHHDIVYILHRLLFLRAFHFTAMPTLLVFQKKRKVERSVQREAFIERTSRPQELINTEMLEELSNIHELYEKLKTSVCSTTNSSVNLSRKDLIPQLCSTVMNFYKLQQKDGSDDGEEDSGEGTSSQQDCSKRAERLAFIKSKAYGEAPEACKSRRHRQVEVDLTSNEAGPSNMSGSTRISKPSLKARTNENVHISATWTNKTNGFLCRKSPA
uniref:Small nuclear RNA activating complex, polypeptide 1b n=1 Tax=Anabas testudineus TaxID=64144 RepID=A0AAQ6IL03_ANATE